MADIDVVTLLIGRVEGDDLHDVRKGIPNEQPAALELRPVTEDRLGRVFRHVPFSFLSE